MMNNGVDDLQSQLDRRNKEIEIIEKVASQINKNLDLEKIATTMLVSMDRYFDSNTQ